MEDDSRTDELRSGIKSFDLYWDDLTSETQRAVEAEFPDYAVKRLQSGTMPIASLTYTVKK